jgi:hypothetical protein
MNSCPWLSDFVKRVRQPSRVVRSVRVDVWKCDRLFSDRVHSTWRRDSKYSRLYRHLITQV